MLLQVWLRDWMDWMERWMDEPTYRGYRIGAYLVAFLAFIASWVMIAIALPDQGLGFLLGWMPALFIGYVSGILWPLILAGTILVIYGVYAK